jgi:plasmid maintenance system antidote protein VapI
MTRQRVTAREEFADLVAQLSPEVVAAELDISESYVSLLKNAKRDPSGAVAARIELQFGIPSVDWYEVA